jgi:hypothetical protein
MDATHIGIDFQSSRPIFALLVGIFFAIFVAIVQVPGF